MSSSRSEPGPTNRVRGCVLLFSIFLAIAAHAGEVIHVDSGATGSNDGTSWTNAFTDLQDALAASQAGDQIWVAAGIYRPVVPADPDEVTVDERLVAFELIDGVTVLGGFQGHETSPALRDWQANTTVLSGDIDDNDLTDADGVVTDTEHINGSNSHTVVFASALGDDAVLDGFVITAGYASSFTRGWLQPDWSGAGMFIDGGSPELVRLRFTGNRANYGAGLVSTNMAAPRLEQVVFRANAAIGEGGGMASHNDSAELVDVLFEDNDSNSGGGMHIEESTTRLRRVRFLHNRADGGGGGIRISNASPTILDTEFRGNEGGGGAIHVWPSGSPVLVNTLFAGNRAIQGGAIHSSTGTSPITPNHPDTVGGPSRPVLPVAGNDRITIINATFSGNDASSSGGAIHNSGYEIELHNTIIWNNRADGDLLSPSASIQDEETTTTIHHSLVANSGGSGNWNPAIGIDGGNNLDADPRFRQSVNPAEAPTLAGNLRPVMGSPTIDAGDNAVLPDIAFDLDGYPRIVNGTVDLGPYEAVLIFADGFEP